MHFYWLFDLQGEWKCSIKSWIVGQAVSHTFHLIVDGKFDLLAKIAVKNLNSIYCVLTTELDTNETTSLSDFDSFNSLTISPTSSKDPAYSATIDRIVYPPNKGIFDPAITKTVVKIEAFFKSLHFHEANIPPKLAITLSLSLMAVLLLLIFIVKLPQILPGPRFSQVPGSILEVSTSVHWNKYLKQSKWYNIRGFLFLKIQDDVLAAAQAWARHGISCGSKFYKGLGKAFF